MALYTLSTFSIFASAFHWSSISSNTLFFVYAKTCSLFSSKTLRRFRIFYNMISVSCFNNIADFANPSSNEVVSNSGTMPPLPKIKPFPK